MNILKIIILLLTLIPITLKSQITSLEKDTRIDKDDLENLSIPQLQRMKEYIYAKHNFTFANDSSKAYFSQFDWYSSEQRNSLIVLSENEELNLIKINDRIESLINTTSHIPARLNNQNRAELIQQMPVRVQGNIGLSTYSIKYIFQYNDRDGNHAIILGESPYSYFNSKQDRPVFNNVIKAVYCKEEDGFLMKRAEIEDRINTSSNLFDIRFMPQYIYLDDINGDGLTDPIITYSSMGSNGYADSRTRISLLYKKNIITIDIQNLSGKKHSEINISTHFHLLPLSIKDKLKSIVKDLNYDGICVLSDNWSEAFDKL